MFWYDKMIAVVLTLKHIKEGLRGMLETKWAKY